MLTSSQLCSKIFAIKQLNKQKEFVLSEVDPFFQDKSKVRSWLRYAKKQMISSLNIKSDDWNILSEGIPPVFNEFIKWYYIKNDRKMILLMDEELLSEISKEMEDKNIESEYNNIDIEKLEELIIQNETLQNKMLPSYFCADATHSFTRSKLLDCLGWAEGRQKLVPC